MLLRPGAKFSVAGGRLPTYRRLPAGLRIGCSCRDVHEIPFLRLRDWQDVRVAAILANNANLANFKRRLDFI